VLTFHDVALFWKVEMLTELQEKAIRDLLFAWWDYGDISTLLEIPESIVLTVRLGDVPDLPPSQYRWFPELEDASRAPRSRDRFFNPAK